MTDDLTRPERFAGLQAARRILDRVKEAPCGCCTHRLTAFGGCGLIPERTFPKCVDLTPGFTPDHAVLYAKDVVE